MPQKVKISAGYADKSSENYNSRQYSINLEIDVTVNGTTKEVEDASERLFRLCRKIVESQKGISVDNLLNDNPPQPTPPAKPAAPPAPTANGNGKLATDKQIKFIFRLGKQSKLSNEQINALPGQYFGKPNFNSLTASEGSNLIETLSASKAA